MNIYYKTKVEEYDNKNCFLIYFSGLGMFLNTPDKTFKIFEKEFYENSIDDLKIDEYTRTREFETVVKFWRPEHFLEKPKIEWYNDFDKNINNLKILRSRLIKARKTIHIYPYLVKKLIINNPREFNSLGFYFYSSIEFLYSTIAPDSSV